MAGRVLVVGASGRVGSALVAELLARGALVTEARRRPQSMPPRRADCIAARFDLQDPSTFSAALRDVDRVFLIARPGDDDSDRLAVPFIDATARAGVRHVVDLTAMGVGTLGDNALRRIENHLERSGMAWTHLRPNWFMQIFTADPLLTGIRAAGVIAVPVADARISFIDVRDIAAVSAVALTGTGHEGRACTLTGHEALTHEQVASLIAASSGRPVRYAPIDDDTARQRILAAGLSSARAERLVTFYRLVRSGWSAAVSPDVERLLGRPPIAFERFARESATCWR